MKQVLIPTGRKSASGFPQEAELGVTNQRSEGDVKFPKYGAAKVRAEEEGPQDRALLWLDGTNFMELLVCPSKSLIAMVTGTFITLAGNSNFTAHMDVK